MPTTYKLKIWLVILSLFFGAIGCKKFVEITPPETQLVTESVFNSDANATAAQTVIYSQMNAESYYAALYNGLLADELKTYATTPNYLEFYENAMRAQDISYPWQNGYNYIYQANAVINGLQNTSGVTAAGKKQLIGEAKFVRAFWHFQLANCYGDVPLVTTPDYNVNQTIARTSKAAVYQQVINDLLDAASLLNPNYVDETDTTISADRIRPNKWAAVALLARAYLYAGKYDSAEQQSTLVINNSSQYTLCQSLDSVFLANNTEAIWQIPPVQPSSNPATPDGQFFILLTAPSGSSNVTTTISSQLMGSFEPSDLRMTHWIGSYTDDNNNTYYYPFKYKLYQASSPSEFIVILRLAEQYLIKAEAEVQLGNFSSAVSDLNVIRNRAGLQVYSGSVDQTSLMTAILHERQVELFTEWGHRWFDLNRTGMIGNVMDTVTPLKGGGAWSSYKALYPLSQSELNYDHNLTQNAGY